MLETVLTHSCTHDLYILCNERQKESSPVLCSRLIAATYYVAPGGDDGADGTSWATPFRTINYATDTKAKTGDLVIVSNGTYVLSSEIRVVSKQITVRALSNNPRDTVIDGNGSVAGVIFAFGKSTFSGFTVSNGWTTNFERGRVRALDG